MKLFLYVSIIFTLFFMSLVFIIEGQKEPKHNELKREIKLSSLDKLHNKFLKIDIDSKNLDINQTLKEIKKARIQYPLDDKLKTIYLELENRYANKQELK